MTTEKYDFIKNRKPSWFNKLLLSQPVDKLISQETWDSSDMQVELKVNGENLCIKDFNEILQVWADRICEDIRNKLDYNSSEEAVVAKAQELIKEKLNKTYEALSDIENSLWKLED